MGPAREFSFDVITKHFFLQLSYFWVSVMVGILLLGGGALVVLLPFCGSAALSRLR
jgi:hypothetical protein